MPIDVERRHPNYKDWSENSHFLWSSYLGGKSYADAEWSLDKYARELDSLYSDRKNRTYYLNYFGAAVDTYVASVFKRDPVREPAENEGGELPPLLQEFLEDATGDG